MKAAADKRMRSVPWFQPGDQVLISIKYADSAPVCAKRLRLAIWARSAASAKAADLEELGSALPTRSLELTVSADLIVFWKSWGLPCPHAL
jgi:hypothetical protein